MKRILYSLLMILPLTAWADSPVVATDIGDLSRETSPSAKPDPKRPYSPYAELNIPMRPLFGDTHVHTSFSMDAGAFGARLGPKEAFRFGKGEEVKASSGQMVKLARPLDFIVVADHSDGFGFFPQMLAGAPQIVNDPQGKKWYDMIKSGKEAEAAFDLVTSFSQGKLSKGIAESMLPTGKPYKAAWEESVRAADEANQPGRFTAFIGFEWTSNTGGNNLHRNVIFRENGKYALQIQPYVTQRPFGSDNPRDLWKWMADYEKKTGGRMLAIAHNGNLSNGRMFPIVESFSGKNIDREYAENRTRWEPLYEVTQIKGDGETHPFLSPNDEFANFERWDKGNLDLTEAKKPEMLEFEYARSALRNGLKLQRELGLNPYKFGLIGSTDAHTALSAVEEDNFFGKTTSSEPSADRAAHPFVQNKKTGLQILGWETISSGYAAVWAKENTREEIFAAMERRETYATTGPRMVVRFFGGWDFKPDDLQTRMPALTGYKKGVPMGGDLKNAPKGKAPTFLIAAMKDPIGANLDRVQVIKGWLDKNGKTHERVFDVSVSGSRKIVNGTCKTKVGNTVDIPNATWKNSIGASELATVWKDPEFNAAQSAFYYVRVIEIPTPRWTAYDAKYFGVKMPKEVPMTTTERAYTSPIWYTPGT